jgi:hypothetical protein
MKQENKRQNGEFQEIKNKLEYENFMILQNSFIFDLCILPNDCILATTHDSLRIYNENFQEIMKKEFYQGYANGCELSPKKFKIYISNHHDGCIDVYDLSINKQNSIGSEGKGNKQFYGIGQITCYKSYLYVCDQLNRRIQVLEIKGNEDEILEFIDSIPLDDIPYTIKISKGIVGVCCNGGTYFYDLETKKLLIEFSSFYGCMNLINSIFVVTQSTFLMKYEDQRGKILIVDFERNNFIKTEIIKVSKIKRNVKKILNYKTEILVIFG